MVASSSHPTPRRENAPHSQRAAVSNLSGHRKGTPMDHRIVMITVGVAIATVVVYLLVMRIFFRESKELDKHIDYSKMKEWKDDDDR
jgi:low affinity Fe/Cu permease